MLSGDFASKLQMISVQFMPFLMAIVVHEFGHGWMAKRWGDLTAYQSGRLTLNPVPHIHPIGTILFPLLNMITGIPIMFGWANPVPINPRNFRKFSSGLFWVSFAGPLFNFMAGIISAFILVAVYRFSGPDFFFREPFILMAQASVGINFGIGFFNLLPVPTLDGGRMIESQLGPQAQIQFARIEPYSFWILLIGLWTGMINFIMYPINIASNISIGIAELILGRIF